MAEGRRSRPALGRRAAPQDLTKYELATLSDMLESEVFDAGEAIIQQGDLGNYFYILEDGEAKAYIGRRPQKPDPRCCFPDSSRPTLRRSPDSTDEDVLGFGTAGRPFVTETLSAPGSELSWLGGRSPIQEQVCLSRRAFGRLDLRCSVARRTNSQIEEMIVSCLAPYVTSGTTVFTASFAGWCRDANQLGHLGDRDRCAAPLCEAHRGSMYDHCTIVFL